MPNLTLDQYCCIVRPVHFRFWVIGNAKGGLYADDLTSCYEIELT